MSESAFQEYSDSSSGDTTYVENTDYTPPAETQGNESGSYNQGSQSTDNSGQQDQIKDNPAWNDLLSPIPQEFHGHLKEHLSQRDKYLQQEQQRFAPYKDILETGIPAQDIDQALQLAYAFQSNPRGVFDFLNQQYNFGAALQQQNAQSTQQQARQDQQGDEFDLSGTDGNVDLSQIDLTKHPQFQQMAQALFAAQQQAQMGAQWAQEQQRAQIDAQVQSQLDNEVSQIKQQYPHIPVGEIAKRAIANASVTNRPEDLFAAAKELDQMGWFQRGPQNSGRTAPPNLSGGGNRAIPSNAPGSPRTMTPEQRSQWVADQLRAAQQG